MKKLIALIKLHCEAGTILEHMDLFDTLEKILNEGGEETARKDCKGGCIEVRGTSSHRVFDKCTSDF